MEEFNSVSACTVSGDYIIYKTTNMINDMIYVGQHYQKTSAFDGYLGSGLLIKRAIKKNGKENFIRETIEYCTSADLDKRETYWIAELSATNKKIGYNLAVGGLGSRGHKVSEEGKRRISKANTGRIVSKELRRKFSIKFRGEKNPNYGRTWSTEQKQKGRERKIGMYIGLNNPNNKYEYILENNKNFWDTFTIKQRDQIKTYFLRANRKQYTDTIVYKGITITRKLKGE